MKIKIDCKFIFLFALALVLLGVQTIAFSALSGTMTISGKSYARIATDVRISNFMLSNVVDGISNYDEFSKSTISTGFTLNSASSTVVYTIEVSNYNSNNIGIYSISGLPEGLNYSISDYTVGNGSLINGIGKKTFNLTFSGNPGNYEFILNFDFRSIYNISYVAFSSTGYPSYIFENETKMIDFSSEDMDDVVITADGNVFNEYGFSDNVLSLSDVTNNIVIRKKKNYVLKKGDLSNPGSEICLGDECFYLLKNDNGKVNLLSKYNLYVGGNYDVSADVWTPYGGEATGIQNIDMKGHDSSGKVHYGTTPFSTEEVKGTEFSTYSGSIVEGYVNNYGDYLKNKGGIYSKIRLITKEELDGFSCDAASYSCSSAPSFIYSTSYWSESAGATYSIWRVYGVIARYGADNYYYQDRFGVRPVIEVSADDIEDPFVHFTVYGEERVALKGMTYAEWVFSDYNTIGEFQMCNAPACDSNLLTDAGFPLAVNGESLMCTTVINEGDEVTTLGSGRFP